MATDYEILEELESIFKADHRTKKYTIEAADEPDNLPSPNICPMINILPTGKERDLTRMSGTPYTVNLTFDVIIWEMSAGGFKNAFKLISAVEENVFAVLHANKSVRNKVSMSVIGATEYTHIYYEDTFYIKGIIPFIIEKDQ